MEYKVAVLSENLRGMPADFLGPAYFYAIALGKEAHAGTPQKSLRCGQMVMAIAQLSVRDKGNAAIVQSTVENLIQTLDQKLDGHVVGTFLIEEEIFRETIFRDKRAVFIPPSSRPWQMERARELSGAHHRNSVALLALEDPAIPFFSTDIDAHHVGLASFGATTLYNTAHPLLADAWADLRRKKKMLLHICCGPDAAGVIGQLKEQYDLHCFWNDPNIQPKAEYDLRLAAFVKVAQLENVPYNVGEYDADRFLTAIEGLERSPEQGAKCSVCYDLRLERSAIEAKRLGCDFYTTTLAISPHKVQEKLKAFGELNFRKHGVPYYAKNFMVDDGFKRSVEFTHDHDIYRQDYCGCWFSLHEGGPRAQQMAAYFQVTKDDLADPNFQTPTEDQ